ncbi:MAG: exopolysaccharide biosynthesis polyprenyl glycosylphosphotransferase [Bacteroidota bacterium]
MPSSPVGAPAQEPVRVGTWPARRWQTPLMIVLLDVVALALVYVITLWVAGGSAALSTYLPLREVLTPAALLFSAYLVLGLHNVVGVHPAQEFRRVCLCTITVLGVYGVAVLTLTQPSLTHVATYGLFSLSCIVLIPVVRVLGRILLGRTSWWGVPVAIIATERGRAAVVETLERWPELGLRPGLVIRSNEGDGYPAIPANQAMLLQNALATGDRIPYAILAMPECELEEAAHQFQTYTNAFRRVFVMPDLHPTHAYWRVGAGFEGLLGYTISHTRWSHLATFSKRLLDLVGAGLLLVLTLPLFLAIALLIKFSAPGPVFFRQERMGQDGRAFKVWKFRSMYVDAEERLQHILDADPELREEYEVFHKLRNDPRVTSIGQLLRVTSLDELPQLLNVLTGEMSLVGPRAYMPSERPKMLGMAGLVLQAPPGLTGLWQVSGRNKLSFEERVRIDAHYVQHRNTWLDLYILLRTIPVVLFREGVT